MISSLNLSKHTHSISMFVAGASSALALGYLYCRLRCQKSGKGITCMSSTEDKKDVQTL
jgi:uncharacterized protein YqjF (DUF2071 family)